MDEPDAAKVVGVVDVGLGNVGSVVNMLRYLEHEPALVRGPEDLDVVDRVILPGVGHFDAGMRRLGDAGLDEAIARTARAGTPVLGVCLGMQLLTQGSDEGERDGLGLIPVRCRSLRELLPDDAGIPVPHMGWNEVATRSGLLGLDLEIPWRFYFVHSYAVVVEGDAVLGTTVHGVRFASVIGSGSVIGAQFHPEKSHRFGKSFLRAWIDRC